MIELIHSLFLIGLEVWGSLYFIDAFLGSSERKKARRYQFLICFVIIAVWSFAGGLIGWWRVIPTILSYVLLSLLFYKTTIFQSLFLSILNYCLLFMVDYLVFVAAIQRIFPTGYDTESSFRQHLIGLAAKLLWIVFLLIICKIKLRKADYYPLKNEEWLKLSIIPIITLSSIFAMLFSPPEKRNTQALYLFLAMGMVCINVVVIHLMQQIIDKEMTIRVSALVNKNQKNQLTAFEDAGRIYNQQHKKMHDYKNQLLTIQTLLKGNDYKTALNFAEKLTESISVDMSAINTNHPVVNAILNQKYRIAKEKNIPISLKLGDLHKLNISEEDVIIVLGNLLDNAIQECEKIQKTCSAKEFIFIKLVYEEGKMILSIKNPVHEKVEIFDNIIQKEHESGHGIGLLNVKSVVEKYDGDLVLDCDGKEFNAVVIL